MRPLPPSFTAPILIVDDDEPFRDGLAEALSDEGYPVETAPSAPQALDAAFRCLPAIALVDLALPGVDGLQLLHHFRCRHVLRRIPVIILAAGVPKRSMFTLLQLGIKDIFIKSEFSVRELCKRIELRVSNPLPVVRNPEMLPSSRPDGDSSFSSSSDAVALASSPARPARPRGGPPSRKVVEAFGKLRALPRIVEELLHVASNPESSLGDLETVARGDPVVAMRILQQANSAAYLRGAPVTQLGEAVRVLGFGNIVKIVSTGAILRSEDLDGPSGRDLATIWRHSLAAAVFAERLAPSAEKSFSYLAGLLHGLPELFTLQYLGPDWPRWRAQAEAEERTLQSILDEALGCSIDDLTGVILSAYRIPSEVAGSIQCYHESYLARYPRKSDDKARRLDIAHHLAVAAGRPGTDLSCVRPILFDEIHPHSITDILRSEDLENFSIQELQSGLGADLERIPRLARPIAIWRDPRWAAPDPVESILSGSGECIRVDRFEELARTESSRLVLAEPGTSEWAHLENASPALVLHRAPLPAEELPKGIECVRLPVSLSALCRRLDRLGGGTVRASSSSAREPSP